jgi:5'-deoxynucleotidase YfbR-like HD superfamily hydrolase
LMASDLELFDFALIDQRNDNALQLEIPTMPFATPAKTVERKKTDCLAVDSEIAIDKGDAKKDIDAILWSMRLCSIRRYFHQRFWETETAEAEYANRVESSPRLESVADHSWHVADSILLLASHFPFLDLGWCLTLAILHDKMEIITGDKNPVGKDGTGRSTHAFSILKRKQKETSELQAIKIYLSALRSGARTQQAEALHELLKGTSPEARFVKAVDKLQALSFVLLKKNGHFTDKHLLFTLRYSQKVKESFPALKTHYEELRSRLILQVARRRNTSVKRIEDISRNDQLSLLFPLDSQ